MARGNTKSGRIVEGIVIRVDSRKCRVDIGGDVVDCRVRGILFRNEKRASRPVAVGDRVRVRSTPTPPSVVEEVLPRRNELRRPQPGGRRQQVIAANLDQAVLVTACADPALNLRLLDRLLVAVERDGFDAIIVFNKVDLVADRDALSDVAAIYEPLGYRVILTSVPEGDGIDELRAALADRVTVFAGLSGAGKSALLTAAHEGLRLESGKVSETTGKGKHTTTRVSLLPLPDGGYVVDTPGIREFGFTDLEPRELSRLFRDLIPFVDACRFRTCTHDHEADCAVKAAVDDGQVDPHRFDSYMRILESLSEE